MLSSGDICSQALQISEIVMSNPGRTGASFSRSRRFDISNNTEFYYGIIKSNHVRNAGVHFFKILVNLLVFVKRSIQFVFYKAGEKI